MLYAIGSHDPARCLLYQLPAAMEIEFFLDVLDVFIDRLGAHTKVFGDLLVGEAITRKLEDLKFSVTKTFDRVGVSARLLIHSLHQKTILDFVAESQPSVTDRTDG